MPAENARILQDRGFVAKDAEAECEGREGADRSCGRECAKLRSAAAAKRRRKTFMPDCALQHISIAITYMCI